MLEKEAVLIIFEYIIFNSFGEEQKVAVELSVLEYVKSFNAKQGCSLQGRVREEATKSQKKHT